MIFRFLIYMYVSLIFHLLESPRTYQKSIAKLTNKSLVLSNPAIL